jgi:hypothetical protein
VLTKVMWSLLVIAAANVAVSSVSFAVYVCRPPAENAAPPFLLLPLTGSAFVASFVGGFCGLVLLAVSDEGASAQVILIALTLILLTCAALGTTWLRREIRRSARSINDE